MEKLTRPLPLLVATHDGAGDLLERVHHDHGLAPLAVSDATTTASAHVDALGSLVALTDASSGAELRARSYTAFGELDTQSSATGAPDTRLGFAWSTDDPSAGLTHLRARDYEPGVGRFTTTDPVAPVIEDPYVSSYLYVGNRPGSLIDPAGTCWWDPSRRGGQACRGGDTAVGDHLERHKQTYVDVGTGVAAAGVCIGTAGWGCPAAITAGVGVRAGTRYAWSDAPTSELVAGLAVDAVVSGATFGLGSMLGQARHLASPAGAAVGRWAPPILLDMPVIGATASRETYPAQRTSHSE